MSGLNTAVITVPAFNQPNLLTSALIHQTPTDGDVWVLANGPGMHLNLAFSAGAPFVEAACRYGAKLLGLGPFAASQAIEALFCDDAERLVIQEELYQLRCRQQAAVEGPVPTVATSLSVSKSISKIKKLCARILKYTSGLVSMLFC